MSLINVKNLTFCYEGSCDNVFENVSFRIDTDWKLGFTGRNGRGKTTFLNLLMGKYPYSGTIHANVDFEYFPYKVNDTSQYALDVMKSTCPTVDDWELIREVSLLDADAEILYRPFDTLSSGEKTKVLLAALFMGENKFLLIDEPTNHLDVSAREAVGKYLRRKKGFILVSHDRALLDLCVDHILSINKTNIEIQQGNFSSWQRNKQLRDDFELSENARLKKEINRLSQAAKRTASWSEKVEKTKNGTKNSGLRPDKGYIGHKSAKIMQRAKNQENRMLAAAEEKSGLLRNIEKSDSLKLIMAVYPKSTIINAADLSLYYGDTLVCSNVTFKIEKGDRLAVVGKNGSGKSTLLKLLCGENIKHEGFLKIGSNLKISYVSQDTSFLKGSLSKYAEKFGIEESLMKSMLRKLGFERSQFEKNIEEFSEGQKKKVIIARSLCEQAHLYIWDEPLNFIDVISRIQIEDLILKYQPTMIFVEHDIAFRNNIATAAIEI